MDSFLSSPLGADYGWAMGTGGPSTAPQQPRACFYCRTAAADLRKCAGCGALYCNRQCQRADWRTRNHKAVCWKDETFSQLETVDMFNMATASPYPGSKPQPGEKFLVKIQPDLLKWNSPMGLYNQSRTVNAFITPDDPHYAELQNYIRVHGYNKYTGRYGQGEGIKWYWWADLSGEGRVRVYVNRPIKTDPKW